MRRYGCLAEDEKLFTQHLLELSYTESTMDRYKWVIERLSLFMFEKHLNMYSPAIGENFLDESEKSGRFKIKTLKLMRCVVRRFNDYKERGEFKLRIPCHSRECPKQFMEELTGYLQALRRRGLKESTVERHRYNIHKALLKFDESGIQNCAEIKPEIIYNAFEKTSDKPNFYTPLRGFLSYLFDIGVISFDYSAIVPAVRTPHPIPSVYTKSEIAKFLNCCDTSANSGKRDLAVILLALRLGMRSCDIANLKMRDVDFDNKEIRFVQIKTEIPQRLELLPEIEDALLSYISSSRPDSDIPNIFITLTPPIRPIKRVYHIVSHYFKRADVDIGERKCGGHALRMTFSSELVAEKIPYDAVRKLLGHEDPTATKHYVKFDIESLRSCAIKIPPITGKLAEYMNYQNVTGGEQ